MTEVGGCGDADLISSFEGFELLPHIVRLIARGEPALVEDIAALARQPQAEVQRVLRSEPGTDWDDSGRLLGLGLTLRPTAHRFIVGSRVLYTWCAADAFYFAVMLGTQVQVKSDCPATHRPVRVAIRPDAVVSVEPADAVVSHPRTTRLLRDVRAEVCDHGHFFSSPTAASRWAVEHPGGEFLSVAETFERCRAACEQFGWVVPAHTAT